MEEGSNYLIQNYLLTNLTRDGNDGPKSHHMRLFPFFVAKIDKIYYTIQIFQFLIDYKIFCVLFEVLCRVTTG